MTDTDPRCAKCGHKRSQHHYRHPFVGPSVQTTIDTQDATIKALVEALGEAIATIEDYVDYEHDGGWRTEDARAMGEMDIDDYAKDGRLTNARTALAAAKETT